MHDFQRAESPAHERVLLCCCRWSESRMLEISAQIAQRLGKYVTDFQSYEKEKA